MVFNTSSAEVLDRSLGKSMHHDLIRQLMYACLGVLGAFVVWQIGERNILKISFPLLFFLLFLLVMVLIPKVGILRGGARRWIGIGSFTFQPSEFAKVINPLVFIEYVRTFKGSTIDFLSFFKIATLLSLPIFLVMIEPDNGTAAVMGLTLLPLFFLTKISWKYWALPVLALALIGGACALRIPYVQARLSVYLDPTLDLKGKGHQPYQAKIAAGSGKLWGKGAGESLQKLTYLPEAQNDYIAAIFAEEFGFSGMLLLVTLYLLFTIGGFSIALKASSSEACYIASALTFLITIQSFLNLAVVSGLLPSKGVNLPFFSQGGTSLIANILASTLILKVSSREGAWENG